MQNNTPKEKLLEVQDLHTSFFTHAGEVKAVDGVSYYINKGEVVALVGESGCGKSVTQMSITQLIQMPPGKILKGKALFEGEDILQYGPRSAQMNAVRGAKISMIFQEPMTSLNPVLTIGDQLSEVIRTHTNLNRKQAWEKGIEALKSVSIPDPERRMKNYPFEMSGGMRQRVMIATAVACNSKLIIADEPTTALDVTTQAQIMDLLMSVVERFGTSLLVVTHNLGLVTRYADRIYVMYAGRIIESGTTEDILTAPKHPYTKGLLRSVPRLDENEGKKLVPIKGAPPSLADLPAGCAFRPRCAYACEICATTTPTLKCVGAKEHYVACCLKGGEENDK